MLLRRLSRVIAAVSAAGIIVNFVLAPSALAYDKDMHYDAKFAIALAVGWSWSEARTIASADFGIDKNPETIASIEPLTTGGSVLGQPDKNYKLHCFSREDDSAAVAAGGRNPDVEETMAGLERQAHTFIQQARRSGIPSDATRALIAIGVYLHCQEDSWSHGGSGGFHFGHGVETVIGDDPDAPASRPDRTEKALKESTLKLGEFLTEMTGLEPGISASDVDPLVKAFTDARMQSIGQTYREICDQSFAERWLYLTLQRKGLLDDPIRDIPLTGRHNFLVPEDPSLIGSDTDICKAVHDSAYGPVPVGDANRIAVPLPLYPKYNDAAFPSQVAADGSYLTVDGSFAPSPNAFAPSLPPQPVANRAPTVRAIQAVLSPPITTYSVEATDPEGDALTYTWTLESGEPTCTAFSGNGARAVWRHDGTGCSHVGPLHSGTIRVVVSDGKDHSVTRVYTDGSAQGSGSE